MFFWKNREKNNPKIQNRIKFEEVLEHLSDNIISNESSKMIGYRYDATGVFGYDFYKENEKLCSVSSVVVPSPPVMMFGFGNKWKSEFENCTIVPGLTRYVYDCSTGRRIYKIVYRENGKYEINNSVIAYCNAERYAFFWREFQVLCKQKKLI